jgi:hypothetical protein
MEQNLFTAGPPLIVLLKSANLNITLPQEAHPVSPPKRREDRFLIWTRVASGIPLLVVSRTQVSMAWQDDKGKMQTATVMTFKDVDSLKAGNVSIVTPKRLNK